MIEIKKVKIPSQLLQIWEEFFEKKKNHFIGKKNYKKTPEIELRLKNQATYLFKCQIGLIAHFLFDVSDQCFKYKFSKYTVPSHLESFCLVMD